MRTVQNIEGIGMSIIDTIEVAPTQNLFKHKGVGVTFRWDTEGETITRGRGTTRGVMGGLTSVLTLTEALELAASINAAVAAQWEAGA